MEGTVLPLTQFWRQLIMEWTCLGARNHEGSRAAAPKSPQLCINSFALKLLDLQLMLEGLVHPPLCP